MAKAVNQRVLAELLAQVESAVLLALAELESVAESQVLANQLVTAKYRQALAESAAESQVLANQLVMAKSRQALVELLALAELESVVESQVLMANRLVMAKSRQALAESLAVAEFPQVFRLVKMAEFRQVFLPMESLQQAA